MIYANGNAGATFMDWSLHYLAGKDVHFSWSAGRRPVCQDPLTINDNAHGHQRNVLSNFGDVGWAHKRQDLIDIADAPSWNSVFLMSSGQSKKEEEFLQEFDKTNSRLIVLCSSHDLLREMPRDHGMDFYNFEFFKNKILEDYPLTNIGRVATPGLLREFLALGGAKNYDKRIEICDRGGYLGMADVMINQERWISCPEEVIVGAMRILGLECREEKLTSWRLVASRWVSIMRRADEITKRWPHIINSVMAGDDFDCGRLTTWQEGALMYDVLRAGGGLVRAMDRQSLPQNARDIAALIR